MSALEEREQREFSSASWGWDGAASALEQEPASPQCCVTLTQPSRCAPRPAPQQPGKAGAVRGRACLTWAPAAASSNRRLRLCSALAADASAQLLRRWDGPWGGVGGLGVPSQGDAHGDASGTAPFAFPVRILVAGFPAVLKVLQVP